MIPSVYKVKSACVAKKTVPNLTNSPTYVQHAVRAARTLALRYGQDREIVLAEFSLDGTGCRLVLSRYSETRVDWLKDFAKTRYCCEVGTWTSTVYSTFISVNPGYTSPYRDGDESSPLMESGNRVGRWFETVAVQTNKHHAVVTLASNLVSKGRVIHESAQ